VNKVIKLIYYECDYCGHFYTREPIIVLVEDNLLTFCSNECFKYWEEEQEGKKFKVIGRGWKQLIKLLGDKKCQDITITKK